MNRITPDKAAKLMGKSRQFVRIGMQRNLLDIGGAVKMPGGRWSYNIVPKKLAHYLGITEEEVLEYVKKR